MLRCCSFLTVLHVQKITHLIAETTHQNQTNTFYYVLYLPLCLCMIAHRLKTLDKIKCFYNVLNFELFFKVSI